MIRLLISTSVLLMCFQLSVGTDINMNTYGEYFTRLARAIEANCSETTLEEISPLVQQLSSFKNKFEVFEGKIDKYKHAVAKLRETVMTKEELIMDFHNMGETYIGVIKLKDKQIADYKSKIDAQEVTMQRMDAQIDTLRTKVDSYDLPTKDREEELTALQSKLEEQEAIIKKREIQIAEYRIRRDANLANLKYKDSQIFASKSKINYLKKLRKIKEDQITTLKIEIAKQQSNLEDKDDELARFRAKTIADKSTIIEKETRIIELEAQTLNFKTKLSNSANTIQVLYNLTQSYGGLLIAQEDILSSFAKRLDNCEATNCLAFGNSSDIHTIQILGVEPFSVACDSDIVGIGWAVIQHRFDGSVDFKRGWNDYKFGFGNLTEEFFLGLERIYQMTRSQPQELYIQLQDLDNQTRYARYDNFSIGSEKDHYRLISLGEYTGNATDALRRNENQNFTTIDRDNDAWAGGNCAERYTGAWWYQSCSANSNLNGQYLKGELDDDNYGKGIFWNGFHGMMYSLKSVRMMIRPRKVK